MVSVSNAVPEIVSVKAETLTDQIMYRYGTALIDRIVWKQKILEHNKKLKKL